MTDKEKIKDADKRYRENSKEKIADYQKKYYEKNKETRKEYDKNRYLKNKSEKTEKIKVEKVKVEKVKVKVNAKKRLERYQNVKSYLENNSIINLIDFSKLFNISLSGSKELLNTVCCREGFLLKSLNRGNKYAKYRKCYQVRKMG